MATARRYNLLCPIARALDRVGDRWTLLILRDLHAGPARFSDLLSSLTGIASNLLTDRLRQLAEDGLVGRRDGGFGVTLYELTGLGHKTNDILFELARLGGRFPPTEDLRRPPNFRTIAVALKTALRRVVEPDINLTAELIVDGEPFVITVTDGFVDVLSGALEGAGIRLVTGYEPLLAMGDGRMTPAAFMAAHCEVTANDRVKADQFAELFGKAVGEFE